MKINDTITLSSGFSMPILGLGTWDLRQNTVEIVTYALQIGYRMIDTARDYGSQVGIGDALSTIEINRDDIFLITKIEEDDEDPYAAAKIDLMKLRQPYSDLVLIHRPPDNGISVELWQKLRQVRDEGLAKSIGVSNYSIEQLQELILLTDEAPAVNQVEWSPFGYQPDMLRYCQNNNIVLQAYSPLTHGKKLDDPTLKRLAENYNVTPAQILIRWNLQNGVVPIVKASQMQHLEENIDVFDFEISTDDMNELNSLNRNYSALS